MGSQTSFMIHQVTLVHLISKCVIRLLLFSFACAKYKYFDFYLDRS